MSSRGRSFPALPAVEEFGVFALASAVLRRKRWIIGIPVLAAVMAFGVSLLLPRSYTAQVVLAPESRPPSVILPVALPGSPAPLASPLVLTGDYGPAYYAQLLRSRVVFDEVLRGDFPDPRRPDDSAKAALIELLPVKGAPRQRLAEGRRVLDESTAVQYDPATGFVTLTAAAPHPTLAAAIADRFAVVVDQVNLELRQRTDHRRRLFVEQRILAAEAELVASEETLRRFLEANRSYQGSPSLQIAHSRLQRQVEIKEAALASIHRDHVHARIQEMNDLPVLTIIERAEVPTEPSSPATGVIVLLALLAGAAAGLLLALFLEMRERVRPAAGPGPRPPVSERVRPPAAPSRTTPVRSPAFWAGVLLALPIFVQVGGSGIGLAPSYAGTGGLTVLPASVLTIPAFLLILVLAGRRTRFPFFQEDLLVALYVAVVGLSALGGLLLNQSAAVPGASRLTVARFGQAVFPLAGYFLARLVVRPGPDGHARLEHLSAFIAGLSLTVMAALAGYLLQTGLGRESTFRFSVLADHIGPFYNYKMKRFFPSYVAIASVGCLAYYLYSHGRRSRRLLGLAAFAGAAGALMLMWSRTAMLMWLAGVAPLLSFAMVVRQARVTRRVAAVLLLLALGASSGVLLMVQLQAESPRLFRTALVLLSTSEEVGRGDVTRFERMGEGVRAGLGQPLGDMHRIYVAGRERRDILESENGYLDFAVRAGPVAMLAIIALFLLGLLRGLRLAWRARLGGRSTPHRWGAFAFAGILLTIVLVGNVWLNLATEPYFAPLVWFLVGTAPALGTQRDTA